MKIAISELRDDNGDSDYSSDSDDEQYVRSRNISSYKIQKKEDNTSQLKSIVEDINTKLSKGENVRLENYNTKLFVVHFRGVHFSKSFFDQDKRREYREKIKSKSHDKDVNSPAVYELSGVDFGEEIDSQVKQEAQQQVHDELLNLMRTKPSENFWVQGNHRKHDNLLYQHYHRYVNNYPEFIEESSAKQYQCYKMLHTTKNPYVSTTDDAAHAVYYALGGKSTIVNPLRPKYDTDLKAKHPKVGYIQVIMHSIEDIIEQHPLFLSSLHGSKFIDIKCRTLYEKETTFLGFIPSANIIDNIVLRFPSLKGSYKSYYSDKYGITKQSFNRFQKSFNESETTGLLEKIASHYEEYLMSVANNTAKSLGGNIVYISLDGTISLTPSYNRQISDLRSSSDVFDMYSVLNLCYSSKKLEGFLFKTFSLYEEGKGYEITIPGGFCDVTRDGLCFYHAISHHLTDISARNLQEYAIEHIINNQEYYHQFLIGLEIPGIDFSNMNSHDAIKSYTRYHQDIRSNTWADHLMIQAVADKLSIGVEVHMFNVDGTQQLYQTGERTGEAIILNFTPNVGVATRNLVIGNISNLHFVTQEIMDHSESACGIYTPAAQELNQDVSEFSETELTGQIASLTIEN